MQRDCRMCRTVEQNVVDERAEVGFFLRSRIERTKKSGWIQTWDPSSRLVAYLAPVVRLVFFPIPAFFLRFFLIAVRCLRLTSRVTSCQKGFASRRMTASGWYVAFSRDVSPIAKEKGLVATVMAWRKRRKEREMWSRFTVARSSLRCCARRAQRYKWPRCYAYPNRSRTCAEKKKREKNIY